MDRRHFLSISGVAAAGGLAGCTAYGRPAKLTGELDEEGRNTILRFPKDGEDVLRVQVIRQYADDAELAHYPFFIATWQPDGIRVDSLELHFRSPSHTDGFTPAGISLREGAHAAYATIRRDDPDPSTTIVNLPDTEDIGQGSVRVDLLLARDTQQDPQELWIRADASLSGDGFIRDGYRARGQFTMTVP